MAAPHAGQPAVVSRRHPERRAKRAAECRGVIEAASKGDFRDAAIRLQGIPEHGLASNQPAATDESRNRVPNLVEQAIEVATRDPMISGDHRRRKRGVRKLTLDVFVHSRETDPGGGPPGRESADRNGQTLEGMSDDGRPGGR